MKGFIKVLAALFTMFAVVIGALVIFDKITNKNRLDGDYLDCDTEDYDVQDIDN